MENPKMPKMKKARTEGLEQYGKIKAALCGWSGVAGHRSLSRFRGRSRRVLAQAHTVPKGRPQCALPQALEQPAKAALCR
jgi:hypothetical protein